MNISGIVTTGQIGASAVISGSGFGAAQGTTGFFYSPYLGAALAVTPDSWSDISITATIPTGVDVGAQGFFFIQKDDGTPGARTNSFTVLAETPAPLTYFASNTVVTSRPGATGQDGEIGVGA